MTFLYHKSLNELYQILIQLPTLQECKRNTFLKKNIIHYCISHYAIYQHIYSYLG